MSDYFDNIVKHISSPADVGLILGSGLGGFADTLENAQSVSTRDLPGYPQSTVAGHAGRIVIGNVGKTRVAAFQGRVHLYEGYSPPMVVTPVRVAHALGAKILIVTNASGAFTRRFSPGDLLLIEDHINLQFRNPLHALWEEGVRIQDTSFFYDPVLTTLAERVALEERIPLKRGTLAGMLGPTYETRAEARMLAKLGADAGCMSTVPEAIMAVALGMRVLGISCVTNWAPNIGESTLDHDDVQQVAAQAGERFARLLRAILQRMKEEG
ncbi:purine-nucleoside phosphorylase [bacterium]|nr:purine-nucleoside phosphorylase [bacterium]MBU1985212.1 purine-nucleoside phosphorylase [bacterium]